MLDERGRSGVQVRLYADGALGITTQDPESMLHSVGGLTNADGNTAFGHTFKINAYFTSSATGTTTASIFSSDAPFKFRVLGCRVTMLDEANGRLRDGGINHLTISVPGIVAGDVSDLRQRESRELTLSRSGSEEVAADGSLSIVADVRLGSTGSTDTLSVLVELTCLRVI